MRIIRERVPAADLGRVISVREDVGEFSGVVPTALSFGFEAVVAGSPMSDARLEVATVPVELRCTACLAEFRISAPSFVCPRCGASDVEIRDGTDIVVRSIELKEEEP